MGFIDGCKKIGKKVKGWYKQHEVEIWGYGTLIGIVAGGTYGACKIAKHEYEKNQKILIEACDNAAQELTNEWNKRQKWAWEERGEQFKQARSFADGLNISSGEAFIIAAPGSEYSESDDGMTVLMLRDGWYIHEPGNEVEVARKEES